MINGIPAYGAVLPEGHPQEMSAGMTPAAEKTAIQAEHGDYFLPELTALYKHKNDREQLYFSAQPVIDPRLSGQPVLFCELLSDICLLTKSDPDPDISAAFPILSSLLENMLLLMSHKNLMIKA